MSNPDSSQSQKSILSDEDIDTLLQSLASSRDDATEEDAITVLRWAEEIEIAYAILQNVYHGTVRIDVKDGECVFSITEKGIQEVESDPNFDTESHKLSHFHSQTDKIQ